MKEVTIKGKSFTEEEVIKAGKESIRKQKIGFRIAGPCAIAFGIAYLIYGLNSADQQADPTMYKILGIIMCVLFAAAGIVLLVASFTKLGDPYQRGVKYLEKHFPDPVGFDGNVTPLLVGDKEIALCKKPVAKLIVSSSEMKFQVMQDNKFSKIYTGKDLKDYEIKVDNEIVVTSKTKTKKGAGKAIAGGLLFGEAGAIAGAVAGNSKSTTTESQKEIHHYTLVLKVNDMMKPSFVIELPSLEVAEEVTATLMLLCNQTEEEAVVETPKEPKPVVTDKYEELKKLKELLDAGIITQEEFDAKKKELL